MRLIRLLLQLSFAAATLAFVAPSPAQAGCQSAALNRPAFADLFSLWLDLHANQLPAEPLQQQLLERLVADYIKARRNVAFSNIEFWENTLQVEVKTGQVSTIFYPYLVELLEYQLKLEVRKDRVTEQELAERGLLAEADPRSIGSRDDFMKSLGSRLADPRAFALREYGKQTLDEISPWLEQLPAKFHVLIVNPGFVNHIEEFVRYFAAFSGVPRMSPWKALAAFKKRLGTRKVYRALMLTRRQAAGIQAGSMWAANLRLPARRARIEVLESQLEPIQRRMRFHIGGESKSSNFMSVSPSRELCLAVARTVAELGGALPGQRVFLFEMDLPILDLYSVGSRILPGASKTLRVLEGGVEIQRFTEASDIEALVPYVIEPSEIRDVTSYGLYDLRHRYSFLD